MRLGPLLLLSIFGALLFTSSPVAGTVEPSRTSAGPALTSANLSATAHFGGWSWFGTGGLCQRDSNLTFVAHFFGNATGGQPPYAFLWNFGDGSNTSSVRNATHVFATSRLPGTVNMTVTDAAGARALSSAPVYPLSTSCPSQPVNEATPIPLILANAIIVGIIVLGVSWFAVRLVRSRGGGR